VLALAVLTALYLASAAILGRRLVGRPIQILAGLARRLGEGDLQARVQLEDRGELSQLAEAMHRMADDLAAARARAEREYAAHVETLEHLRHADRLATVGKLAAGVAHELGTPLNVSAARARMIETGEMEGSEARDSARIIGAQLQAMTTIIRQLLDFARRRQVQRSRVDLSRLVAQSTRLIGPLAAKKGVDIDISGVPALSCDIDPAQMHQVLTNLLMNAVHAMQRPGRVLVQAAVVRGRPPAAPGKPESDWVRVDVRDFGAGISSEVLPHVFEPFFTTKDVGEGTGLGLSVSWGIVQEHGGWIQVDTQPGVGSTFSVFLPGVEEVECRAASSL
jgi:signal transduction histidine kinase